MLSQCVKSLLALDRPDHTAIEILVVENDETPHAETQIAQLATNSPFPIHHRLEPRQGIPHARNCALDYAKCGNFNYLLFLDDDEWAEPDWLVQIYEYAQKQGGCIIVHGHVISEFPPNAPKHLIALMHRKAKPTGTRLDSCATNNILLPLKKIKEAGLRFDEANPFAGGEDVLFTFAARQKGINIHECQEATVHEEIPANRISLKWLAQRKYWMGIGQLKRDVMRGEKPLVLFPKACCSLVLRLPVVLVFALIVNRKQTAKHWLKICKNAGTIGGLLGRETQAYRTVDGG